MSGVQQAVFQNQRSFGGPPDAQFNYVTMLLHGDGTNGAQNNTFLDSSSNTFTITRNGNTTQGSFSPYGSNWSNNFPTSNTGSDNLTIASTSALSFTASNDLTIESWVYLTAHNDYSYICSKGNSTTREYGLTVRASSIQFYWSTNGTSAGDSNVSASFTFDLGTWYHVAMSKSGTSVRLFVNGTQQGSTGTFTSVYNGSLPFRVGTFMDFTGIAHNFAGYLSNLRIVKGTAVYTSNFTPSTTPLTAITNTSLLTCQSNRFIDNSASPLTITVNGTPSVQRFNPFGTATAYSTSVIGGSGYFDGSGDYLGCGSQSAYAFGTGDFTLNAWFYLTSAPTYMSIADTRTSGWALAIDANRAIYLYSDAVGFVVSSAVGAVPLNAWTYVSVKRVSGTMTLYLNAVSINSAANSTNFSNTTLTIGANGSGGEPFFGYICDFQAIKGTGTTPTLPTAPLTNVTNTSLLLNYTNGAIFDNAMMNNLETVGNSQISTSVYKYGTGSMYFDGTGDALSTPNTIINSLGSGAFTIEMWVYRLGNGSGGISAYDALLGSYSAPATSVYGIYITRSTGVINFFNSAGLVSSSNSLSNSSWTHIAVSRTSANNLQIFINGTSGYSATNTGTGALINPLYIASDGTGSGGNSNFYGYIDDLRITKGYARYTANFTAPTAAFSNTGPY